MSDSFKRDLQKFLGVCRVVNGLRGVRLGAVGARPGAFNTVRYSEKILERHGISVTTVDLSEIEFPETAICLDQFGEVNIPVLDKHKLKYCIVINNFRAII